MRAAQRAAAGLCIALCAGFGPALANGQEEHPVIDGYAFLPEERWGKLTEDDLQRKYYVEGRWHGFLRPGIRFYKRTDMGRFLIVPGKPDDPLFAAVVADRDSLGKPLKKRRSMVRVFGTPLRVGARIVLLVDKVQKLPDEDEQFRARLEALGDDLDAIRALGKRCRERARLMEDTKLAEVARQIAETELRARRKRLAPGDFQGLFELAKRYESDLGDMTSAIALYGEVAESPKAPLADRRAAVRSLARLKAIRMRVKDSYKWVTLVQYRHAEGFIFRRGVREADEAWRRKDRWITREWAEFEDAVRAELDLRRGQVVPVRTNLHQHAEAARRGKVERGQNYVEVSRAAGFPRHVNHWEDILDAKPIVWSQWILPNGLRVYFLDGEVISTRPAGSPWPESEWNGS